MTGWPTPPNCPRGGGRTPATTGRATTARWSGWPARLPNPFDSIYANARHVLESIGGFKGMQQMRQRFQLDVVRQIAQSFDPVTWPAVVDRRGPDPGPAQRGESHG